MYIHIHTHIIPLHGKVTHKCITVTDVHTYKLILTYVQQQSLKYCTDCLDIYTYITKHIWKKVFLQSCHVCKISTHYI